MKIASGYTNESGDSESFITNIPSGNEFTEELAGKGIFEQESNDLILKVSQWKVLTREERNDLFTTLCIGSAKDIEKARLEFYSAYLPIILWVIGTFITPKEKYSDFIEEGKKAVQAAIDLFPCKRYEGYPHFNRYVHWCIHEAIRLSREDIEFGFYPVPDVLKNSSDNLRLMKTFVQFRDIVLRCWGCLDAFEKEVFSFHFGFFDGVLKRRNDVAEKFEISKEDLIHLEMRVLAKVLPSRDKFERLSRFAEELEKVL